MQEIKTNALSAISLLTHLATRFESQGSGAIAVISSVAGDRGRASNYVYGSSKAMLTTFTSGLRQRICKSGISVVTIKPGLIDTPMTEAFKKGFLWTKPSIIAEKIVLAIDKRKNEVYAPFFWWAVMLIIKAIPSRFFNRLDL
jgi:short-subunit dehydrogenase